MGLYLYCIGEPTHPDPRDVDGLDGAPVRGRPTGGFRAWVSELERPPSATLDRVRTHNAVVEAAAREATPLPLRFGQWFASEDALEASLQERDAWLHETLGRVAGALEFGVRVVDPEHAAEALDRASGTAYLEALARRERRAEEDRRRGRALAGELVTWLGPLVREQNVRPLGGEALVSIAHLVDRHDTGNYDSRLREFPVRYPDLEFVFSGPWPPYGFVE